MSVVAGIGYRNTSDSREAALGAARDALDQLGGAPCDVVLLYASGRHHPATLYAAARGVVGDGVPIVGGHAVGIITSDAASYDSWEVGVCTLGGGALEVAAALETGLDEDEHEVGARLAERLADRATERSILLLGLDVTRAAPTADKFGMMARPFLAGLTERLGRRVPILGGSQIGTFAQTRAAQWVNDQASVGAALGVVLTSDLRVDTVITHG